jgi:predicted alpha/beta superfamily hydrolase
LKKALLAALILLTCVGHLNAQVRGYTQTETLYSKLLSEQRDLLIYLPNNYHRNTMQSYPVMYLTDGLRNFNHAAGSLDLLNQSGKSQEMIIVAIKNTHRTRDFTPTYFQDYNEWGISGGADNFLDFIEKELVPYIGKHYRANKFKIISGHSLGGLLAIYALQTRPKLFQAHFSFSPSLWWHDNFMLNTAKQAFTEHNALDSFLYLNLGNETGDMLSAFEQYTQLLEEHKPQAVVYHSDIEKQESHGTSALAGMPKAYRYLNQWLECPEEVISQGLLAIQTFYKQQSEKYGFEIKPSYRSINRAGYNELNKQNYSGAIRLFELNVKHYPHKADAYDSLADGFQAKGELEKALAMRKLTIEKSISENVESNAYKTRLVNLIELIGANNRQE